MATPKYAARRDRISKEELYAVVTLFMEYFETEDGKPAEQGEETEKYRKVGAALVLTNDKIFAIDCSRDDVHAVARLIIGSFRIDDFRTTTPLDCVTGLLRMLIWALPGVAPKSTPLLTAIRRRLRKNRT